MNEHTPTPWGAVKYESGWALIGPTSDDKIARVEKTNGHANAAFIVRAVNAHEELLAALRSLTKQIHLGKLNIRKDFSLINAHAWATKIIAKTEEK